MNKLTKAGRSLILATLLVSPAGWSGINDPWYLAYRVSGGTLTQYMGPYQNRIACESARFQLPIGATFLGCYQ